MSLKHIFNQNAKYDTINPATWNFIATGGTGGTGAFGVQSIDNTDNNLDVSGPTGIVTINMSDNVVLNNLDVTGSFSLGGKDIEFPTATGTAQYQILTLNANKDAVWDANTILTNSDDNLDIQEPTPNNYLVNMSTDVLINSLDTQELTINGKTFPDPVAGLTGQVLTLNASNSMVWQDTIQTISGSTNIGVTGTYSNPNIYLKSDVSGLDSVSATTLNADTLNLNGHSMSGPSGIEYPNYVLGTDGSANMVWVQQKNLLSSVGGTIGITGITGTNICNIEAKAGGLVMPSDFQSGQQIGATGTAGNVALNLTSPFYAVNNAVALSLNATDVAGDPCIATRTGIVGYCEKIGNLVTVKIPTSSCMLGLVNTTAGAIASFTITGLPYVASSQQIVGKYSIIVQDDYAGTIIDYTNDANVVIIPNSPTNTYCKIVFSQTSNSGNTPQFLASTLVHTYSYFLGGLGYNYNTTTAFSEPADIVISYFV